MRLSRRRVLAGLAAGFLSIPAISPAVGQAVFGAGGGAADPLLVFIHQRGGCDGLHLLSPANDPDFIDARVTDLRVLDSGPEAGFAIPHPRANGLDFRLHTAAAGLAELSQHGQLAFIHACGLTNATRSHFVASDMIERGVANEADFARQTTGWLARYGLSHGSSGNGPSGNGLWAATAGGGVDGDWLGFNALAVPDLVGGLAISGGAPFANALTSLYGEGMGLASLAGSAALKTLATLDGKMRRDAQGKLMADPKAGLYDPAGPYGRSMRTVAQLIKMDVGLRAITVDFGGWDTHENQPGRFRGGVDQLSKALSVFWNDMAAYHDRLVVVVVTEFGRRLRSNKSNGTDHGRAGVVMVLGGQVRGGRILGAWPGLKTGQLAEGVDLAVTSDYRQVLSEVLTHQSGATASGAIAAAVFPSFKSGQPLGLFA